MKRVIPAITALITALIIVLTSCGGGGEVIPVSSPGSAEVSSAAAAESGVPSEAVSSSEILFPPPEDSPINNVYGEYCMSREALGERIMWDLKSENYEYLNKKYNRSSNRPYCDFTGLKFSEITYESEGKLDLIMEYTVEEPGKTGLEAGHKYIVEYSFMNGSPMEGYYTPQLTGVFKDNRKSCTVDMIDMLTFVQFVGTTEFTEGNYNELETEAFHSFIAWRGNIYEAEVTALNKAAEQITGIKNYFETVNGVITDIYGNPYCGSLADGPVRWMYALYDERSIDGGVELIFVDTDDLGLFFNHFIVYKLLENQDGSYRIASCEKRENYSPS